MITVFAYDWVPPFAQGFVRDLRVRWALEEAGIPYSEKLITHGVDQVTDWYRALQPFGQVPVYVEGDVSLFESGAIVHYIAQKSTALLPADEAARARAVTWMFSALNTIEVCVQQLAEIDLFFADQEWARQRRPMLAERVQKRLAELAAALGDRDYLDGEFSAGDLLMASVLRFEPIADLLAAHANLSAYLARCEARPAFARALAAQMNGFAKKAA